MKGLTGLLNRLLLTGGNGGDSLSDLILFLAFWALILVGIPILGYLTSKMVAAGFFRGRAVARRLEIEEEEKQNGERN